MLKIRLMPGGKKKQISYRLVVAEHTMPVKGKFIEILGFYNPRTKEYSLKKERINYWLKIGAYPSDTVAMLLRKEKFKLPALLQKPKRYVKAKKEKKKEKPSAPPKEAEKEAKTSPEGASESSKEATSKESKKEE